MCARKLERGGVWERDYRARDHTHNYTDEVQYLVGKQERFDTPTLDAARVNHGAARVDW